MKRDSSSRVHRVAGRAVYIALLVALLAGAAVLRFTGINWDQHQQVHPDERFIVWVANTISLPGSLDEALDPARSTINPFRWPSGAGELAGEPRNYAYGHFPLYLLVIVAQAAQEAAEWFGRTTIAFPPAFQPIYTVGRHLAEYDYLALVGRAISALADLGTLLCVFWLGRFVVGQAEKTQGRQDAKMQSDPDGSSAFATLRSFSWQMNMPGIPSDTAHENVAEHPERVNGSIPKSANRQSKDAALSGDRSAPFDSGLSPSAQGAPLQYFDAVRWPGGRDNSAQDARSVSIQDGGPEALTASPGMSRDAGLIAGLLAAAMYAFAVLPIQLSHYATVDAVLTFCVTAAVALAARSAESSGWGAWLLAGAMTGLAIGSKFSAVLLVVPLAAAALCWRPDAPIGRRIAAAAGRFAAAGGVAVAVFAVTNPFAIIESGAYVKQILAQNAMVSGVMDAPYTRQYIGTWPYFYFVRQLSQWGLGWPLGVVCWGGCLWAIIRAARRQARPGSVIMLAWALSYFAITGAFHTKFLRYMAPLLPFLIVFGAGWAVGGCRWLSARWRRAGRSAWIALAAGTAAFTIAWALAFVSIYRAEHPWIAASRWISMHIPENRKLLTEHWDDALPLTLDELPHRPATRMYERMELPLWDPDTPAKLDVLVTELNAADYVVLASNRLHAPMQRLGARYPMTSQYYRMLFAGDLGYELAAEFSSYPRLGSLTIRDDHADESFTVYDHPRVLVFENTSRLKPELLRARLGRYLPQGAGADSTVMLSAESPLKAKRSTLSEGRQPVVEGCGATNVGILRGHVGRVAGLARMRQQDPAPGAPLTLDQPVDTLPVVADFRWNAAASGSSGLAVVLWWLALSLFGWLAWPLLYPLLPGLRDRGYGLARPAGLLLIGWAHWIGVSLGWWQNRAGAIAAISGVLAAAGLAAGAIQRRRLAAFLAERRRLLLGQEALFALAFLALVGVRLLNPDLWQPWNGGEKFMESAFLNAILRSANFPPYDPYFAGGTINYYYYGLYLVSLPIKLTGIVPEVAFNLAVAGLFAATALGLFSVGYSLAAAMRSGGAEDRMSSGESALPRHSSAHPLLASAPLAGGLAVLFGLLMGNLRDLPWLWRNVLSWLGGRGWQAYDYWAASRVIPNTINEFPLWTFVFADLHPHLIAMPFGLLVVGLALNLLETGSWKLETGDRGVSTPFARAGQLLASSFRRLPGALLFALALGVLGAINTWDLPTYALLVAGALVVGGWRRGRWRGTIGGALRAMAIVGLAVIAYWPFFANYQALVGQAGGTGVARFLGWVRASSPLTAWLRLWLVFLLIALGYVVVAWRERRAAEPAEAPPRSTDTLPVRDEQANEDAATQRREGALSDELFPGFEESGQHLHLRRSAAQVQGSGDSALSASHSAGQTEELPGSAAEHGDVSVRSRKRFVGLLALLGVLALLAGMGRPTAAIAALPLCLALPLAFRRGDSTGKNFLALLIVLGLGVVAGTELVYLRDFLEGGDWYRMNTLFKFSVPAWLILGLASSAMLPMLWAALSRVSAGIGGLARAAIMLLIAASFTFLVFGIRERVEDRFPGARPPIGTLDSTAYMTVGAYTWPDSAHMIQLAPEREAIQWLLDNVRGSPVIAEAPAAGYSVLGEEAGYDYYRAGGLRVASLTGFPTFVGPHQYEQRPGDQVGTRVERGKELFATTDFARARQLMADLRVGYVYVGQLERLLFAPDALRKFDVLAELGDLREVFRNAEVMIYRVAR